MQVYRNTPYDVFVQLWCLCGVPRDHTIWCVFQLGVCEGFHETNGCGAQVWCSWGFYLRSGGDGCAYPHRTLRVYQYTLGVLPYTPIHTRSTRVPRT